MMRARKRTSLSVSAAIAVWASAWACDTGEGKKDVRPSDDAGMGMGMAAAAGQAGAAGAPGGMAGAQVDASAGMAGIGGTAGLGGMAGVAGLGGVAGAAGQAGMDAGPPVATPTGTTPGSPSNALTPSIEGTTEPNASVGLFSDPGCTTLLTEGTADVAGAFSISISVTEDSVTEVYAAVTDGSGTLVGPCSMAGVTYEHNEPPTLDNLPTSLVCSDGGRLAFLVRASDTTADVPLLNFSAGAGGTCGFTPTFSAAPPGDNSVALLTVSCSTIGPPCDLAVQVDDGLESTTAVLQVEVVPPGLDPGFNTTGVFSHSPNDFSDGRAIAIDAMGRIVVGGLSGIADFATSATVWRLSTDGALDASFNGMGFASQSVGQSDLEAGGLAIDAQGRILLAGQATGAGGGEPTVWRFLATGVADSTFGTAGAFSDASVLPAFSQLRGIALVDSGMTQQIGVVGVRFGAPQAGLAYLLDDTGTPVSTFDSDGSLVFTENDGIEVQRVLTLGQGLFVTGATTLSGEAVAIGRRFLLDGTVDGAFGTTCTDKSVNVPSSICFSSTAPQALMVGATVDSFGRVLATGYAEDASGFFSLVWRFSSTGVPDLAFGASTGEWWRTFNPMGGAQARGVAVDSGGRIVFVGRSVTTSEAFVARLDVDGSLDSSFGAGTGFVQLTGSDASPADVLIDADGRYVIIGRTVSGFENQMTVWRVNP